MNTETSRNLALELTVEPHKTSEVASVVCGFYTDVQDYRDPPREDYSHRLIWDKYGVESTWVRMPYLPVYDWRNEEETNAQLLESWGNGDRFCNPVYYDKAHETMRDLIDFQSVDENNIKTLRSFAMFVGRDAVVAAFNVVVDSLQVSPNPRLVAIHNAVVLSINRADRVARGADASNYALGLVNRRLRMEKALKRPNINAKELGFYISEKDSAIDELAWLIKLEHPLVHELASVEK